MKTLKKTNTTVYVELSNGAIYHVPVELYNDGEESESYYTVHGIPYSVSFELLLQELVTEYAYDIQTVLYSAGIHTVADVVDNRKLVNDILKQYISTDKIIKVSKKGDN